MSDYDYEIVKSILKSNDYQNRKQCSKLPPIFFPSFEPLPEQVFPDFLQALSELDLNSLPSEDKLIVFLKLILQKLHSDEESLPEKQIFPLLIDLIDRYTEGEIPQIVSEICFEISQAYPFNEETFHFYQSLFPYAIAHFEIWYETSAILSIATNILEAPPNFIEKLIFSGSNQSFFESTISMLETRQEAILEPLMSFLCELFNRVSEETFPRTCTDALLHQFPKIIDITLKLTLNDKARFSCANLLDSILQFDPTCYHYLVTHNLNNFILDEIRRVGKDDKSSAQNIVFKLLYHTLSVCENNNEFSPLPSYSAIYNIMTSLLKERDDFNTFDFILLSAYMLMKFNFDMIIKSGFIQRCFIIFPNVKFAQKNTITFIITKFFLLASVETRYRFVNENLEVTKPALSTLIEMLETEDIFTFKSICDLFIQLCKDDLSFIDILQSIGLSDELEEIIDENDTLKTEIAQTTYDSIFSK